MARVTFDATQGYKQVATNKNISKKYDDTIRLLKKWTSENFYFGNNNVVRYLDETSAYLKPMHESIKCNEVVYKKSEFDTPLSHLMYILIFAFV